MLEPKPRVLCAAGASAADALVVVANLQAALRPPLSIYVAVRASPFCVTVSVAPSSKPLGIKSGPEETVPNAQRVYVPTGNGAASSDAASAVAPPSCVDAPPSRAVRDPHAGANAPSARRP